MRNKKILLWTIVGLVLINSLFLASAINILTQSFSFTSGRFAFQYDDTKLVIERVGNFVYDSDGKLKQLTVYIKNKDPSNQYSGYIEVIVDSQQYKVDISIKGGKTVGYEIELDPPLEITGTLVVNVNVIISGVAVADLIAQKGAAIADADIDGTIGTEWNDAKQYDDLPITPSGTAKIWVKNDGTYLYMAVQFTADSNDPWLTLQLGTTGCMDSDADVAIFGHNSLEPDGYIDAYFQGTSVVEDASQDGVGAMSLDSGNLVTVELKKPLSSGDSDGNDIAWTVGSTYNLVIAWDSDGGGSSGGNTNHRSATPLARTILISA